MDLVLSFAESFVRALLVPTLVSAAILLLLSRFKIADRVAGALALAGGFFAGYVAVGVRTGSAPLIPTSKYEWTWLPTLALLAGLGGLASLLPIKKNGLRRGISVLVALLMAGMAGWLLVPDFATPRPYYVAGAGAAVFLLWIAPDPLAERQPGAQAPLLLACVAAAAAAVILLAASLKFAELTGPLVSSLAGCALAAYFNPGRRYVPGMLPGFAVLLVGLLLQGHLGGTGKLGLSFLLVLVAPLLLWVGGRGWPQAAAVLAPLAAAVILAFFLEG